MKPHVRTIAVGSVGNIMEWFDFSIYGYFAPIIARVFFPVGDPFLSLLATLGIFASGFLMRPLGAAFFGHLGDTRGRSRALILSVVLMVIPTCLMGFLPTYHQVGLWAPVILTLLRLVQGFSVGGELTGSITYVAEQAPPHRRGLFSSFATFGVVSGMLLGSLVGSLITQNLSEGALLCWGWRLAFWCGLLLGGAIFLVRRGLLADAPPGSGPIRSEADFSPVREVFSQHRLLLVQLFGLASFMAVSFYIVTVYLSTFLTTEAHLPLPLALEINTLSMGILILLIPLMGALSDRWGRKPLMIISSLGFVILSYPLFRILSNGNPRDDLMAQLIFVFLVALFEGTFPALLSELCPARVRMTLFSLSFNLSMAVLGGTTPLIATLLIRELNTKAAPSFFLILVGLICLLIMIGLKETKGRNLNS